MEEEKENNQPEVSSTSDPENQLTLEEAAEAKQEADQPQHADGDSGEAANLGDLLGLLKSMESKIDSLSCVKPEDVSYVKEKLDSNSSLLNQAIRQNLEFQQQVRNGTQKELETLRARESGDQFNPILKSIAEAYCDYYDLLKDETLSPKARKGLSFLFDSLRDILEERECEIVESMVGDPRPTRVCKIIEKIPTSDPAKHNTIALSRRPGVKKGNIVFANEYIDVYVYDSSLKETDASSESSAPEETNKSADE